MLSAQGQIAVLRAKVRELRQHLASLSPGTADYETVQWHLERTRIVAKLMEREIEPRRPEPPGE